MAAILCTPIKHCCELVCTAPCRLCASLSCTNPLSGFVAITLITQVPTIVIGALDAIHLVGGCRGSQWLAGMLASAIAHIAACVYLSHRITFATDEGLRDKHTAWERISHLLCHDPVIALYLLVVIFFVVWLGVGSAWSIGGDMVGPEGCGNNTYERVSMVLGLGWFYAFAGPCVLSCNLCCACCDQRDYAADAEAFAAQDAARDAAREEEKQQQQQQLLLLQQQQQQQQQQQLQQSADIESPPLEAETKGDSKAPRTYSTEGIPINDRNAVGSEVLQADAVEILPPPMLPPKVDTKQAPDTKATVY